MLTLKQVFPSAALPVDPSLVYSRCGAPQWSFEMAFACEGEFLQRIS